MKSNELSQTANAAALPESQLVDKSATVHDIRLRVPESPTTGSSVCLATGDPVAHLRCIHAYTVSELQGELVPD